MRALVPKLLARIGTNLLPLDSQSRPKFDAPQSLGAHGPRDSGLFVFVIARLLNVLLSRNGCFPARRCDLFGLGGSRMLRAATVQHQAHTNGGEGKEGFHSVSFLVRDFV